MQNTNNVISTDDKEFTYKEDVLTNTLENHLLHHEQVGPKAFASLDENGVLTITGTGSVSRTYVKKSLDAYKDNVKKIVCESGITAFRDKAFYDFTAVEEISIPETVTSIGKLAFCRCSALKELTIPGSVKSIGWRVFDDCGNLKKLVFEEGVIETGSGQLEGDVEVYLPASIEKVTLDTAVFCKATVYCYAQNHAAVKWASCYANNVEWLGESITEEQLDNIDVDGLINAHDLMSELYQIIQNNASEDMKIDWDTVRYVIKKHNKRLGKKADY